MFGCLLSLRPFDSLEGPLVRKQVSLPITFSGIEFILTSTITPTTYLGNWALITLVIAIRFMVDQRHFIFKALTSVMTLILGS